MTKVRVSALYMYLDACTRNLTNNSHSNSPAIGFEKYQVIVKHLLHHEEKLNHLLLNKLGEKGRQFQLMDLPCLELKQVHVIPNENHSFIKKNDKSSGHSNLM